MFYTNRKRKTNVLLRDLFYNKIDVVPLCVKLSISARQMVTYMNRENRHFLKLITKTLVLTNKNTIYQKIKIKEIFFLSLKNINFKK